MDRRTPDCYIDPAPHTVRIASVVCLVVVNSAIVCYARAIEEAVGACFSSFVHGLVKFGGLFSLFLH